MYAAGENSASVSVNVELMQCLRSTEDLLKKISTEHKDLHGLVSKVGKAIDRVKEFAAKYLSFAVYVYKLKERILKIII